MSRLDNDPDLRAEVEAAERLGVSVKRFRGWEPVTTHTHDEDGLHTTSTVETEWDEVEHGWMIALALWRENRCPFCGGDLALTTDPVNEDVYRHELPIQCYRCVAFARAHEEYDTELYPQSLIHLVPQRPKRRRKGA